MKTFLFQCSTLMMVIMVYSSSIHNCTNKVCRALLRQIKQDALTLMKKIEVEALNSSNKELETKWVPKITYDDKACVPHFFCLAEKVVQNVTEKPVMDKLSHLHQRLVQYNNQTQETDCTVTVSGSYLLREFLDNVKECVTFTLFTKTIP